jgi:hypothetical protein
VQHKENNMKTTVSKWAVKAAGAGAIALLLATPSFAQSRGDWSRNNSNRGAQTSTSNRQSRGNNNVYQQAQRSVYNQQRDSNPGQFDRGRQQQTFRAPEVRYDNRYRDNDRRGGLSINLGFRSGAIGVGIGAYPVPYRPVVVAPVYANGLVRGVIEQVDYRDGTISVLDDASGRLITASVGGELGGLRNGDYVQLSGQWINGGLFGVAQLQNLGYRG